jgi:heme acquisition protein HasA
MSVTYTFNYDYAPADYTSSSDQSLGNLLDTFDATGADVVEHDEDNTGGFFTDGSDTTTSFQGDTYAGTSTATANYSYSIYAGEDNTLSYDFYTHTVYGTIESITIGSGLNEDGTVQYELLTLDFSDDPITGTLEEGRTNDVHDIVWGLMNSSTTGATDSSGTESNGGLQGYLTALGIDLDATGYLSEDSSSTGTLPETTATLFGETVAVAA